MSAPVRSPCSRLSLTLIILVSLQRKALQAFTFKDGTHIPVGTTMWAPAECIHRDLKVYDRATEFDGFRWVIDSPEDVIGDELSGNGITSTSLDYIVFGHGKHVSWLEIAG